MFNPKFALSARIFFVREESWDRIRLPKFKFSANFSIGLHVILQMQLEKMPNVKNILTENPLGFNLESLLK